MENDLKKIEGARPARRDDGQGYPRGLASAPVRRIGRKQFEDAPGRVAAGLERILMQIVGLRDRTRQIGRMGPDDRFYFLGRAEEELELAQSAVHESAGRAHALLAGYYFDRAYRELDESSDPPPLAA